MCVACKERWFYSQHPNPTSPPMNKQHNKLNKFGPSQLRGNEHCIYIFYFPKIMKFKL